MRITHNMLADTTLRNLNANLRRLEKSQDQLTSGRRISRASDDPVAVARALTYHTGLDEIAQYQRNIDSGSAWLNATDSALGSATQLLQRAQELAVRGANGSLSREERQAIAAEVAQIREQVIQVGNSTFGREYLFGGTMTDSAPFVGTTPTWSGNTGTIEREIGPNARVVINVPGSVAFNPMLDALGDLVAGLNAGDDAAIRGCIDSIAVAMDGVLALRAQVGAKVNRLETAATRLDDLKVNQSELLSKEEDLEMAEALMNYAVQDNVYKAALAAGARAVQPSLLDYLR